MSSSERVLFILCATAILYGLFQAFAPKPAKRPTPAKAGKRCTVRP